MIATPFNKLSFEKCNLLKCLSNGEWWRFFVDEPQKVINKQADLKQ